MLRAGVGVIGSVGVIEGREVDAGVVAGTEPEGTVVGGGMQPLESEGWRQEEWEAKLMPCSERLYSSAWFPPYEWQVWELAWSRAVAEFAR